MLPNKYNYPILGLNFRDSFDQLSDDEKYYAYYLSKACWAGAPIILFQVSYEAPAMFIILQNFFSSFTPFQDLKNKIFVGGKYFIYLIIEGP